MKILALCLVAACGPGPSPNTGDDDDAPPDSRPVDADPASWTSDPACTGTAESIYTTPAQLPAERGAIIQCALGDRMELAETQSEMMEDGVEGVTAQTGARVVKVAYRTQRSDGTAAVSTATVYLPLVPRMVPAPVVLIGRPTSGIADDCAPSKKPRPERNLALPFAARGFVTITPDYAGLGNEGTHAYLDNREAATELFDGAIALQKLLPAGLVGDPVGAVGYSQGGGVVLSAQALENELAGKRTIKGIAAIAPQWPISTRSFDYEEVLRNPDGTTATAGLAPPTVTVLRHYGYLMNKVGPQNGGDAFPAAERESIIDSIESLCTVPLGGALDGQQPKLRDLVDETFRVAMLACIDAGPNSAGCTGRAKQVHAWMTGDFVSSDPAGAKVMIVQGLADQVMPAAKEAACDVAKLRAAGVEPELCTDAFATHDTILEKKIDNVVAWIEAMATGVAAPSCASSTMPACSR